MIESPSGWVLAPAYDLLNVSIVNPNDEEELALSIDGKRKKLKKKHFVQFGNGMGLTPKQIEGAFNRIINNKPKAIEWINKSFLTNKMKKAYLNILENRYDQLKNN